MSPRCVAVLLAIYLLGAPLTFGIEVSRLDADIIGHFRDEMPHEITAAFAAAGWPVYVPCRLADWSFTRLRGGY